MKMELDHYNILWEVYPMIINIGQVNHRNCIWRSWNRLHIPKLTQHSFRQMMVNHATKFDEAKKHINCHMGSSSPMWSIWDQITSSYVRASFWALTSCTVEVTPPMPKCVARGSVSTYLPRNCFLSNVGKCSYIQLYKKYHNILVLISKQK